MQTKYGKPSIFSDAPVPKDTSSTTLLPTQPSTRPAPLVPDSNPPSSQPQEKKPVETPAAVPNSPPKKQDIHNTFNQTGSESIRTMQQKMIDLSKEMSGHPIHGQDTDPFMNFIVTNYMKSAPRSNNGKQLVDTSVSMPDHGSTSKEIDHFKGVFTSIARIGAGGSDKPDGVWGWRTNNALNLFYQLAYALMEVQKKMALSSEFYTDADLNELHSKIPAKDSDLNLEQKNANALVITKNLEKFRAVYDNFRDKILNPYSKQISQQAPLFKMEERKSDATQFNDQESNLLKKHYDSNISVVINDKPVVIKPANLHNIGSFAGYLNTHATELGLDQEMLNKINHGDQTTINKFVNDLMISITYPDKEPEHRSAQ